MKYSFFRPTVIVTLSACLMLSACSDTNTTTIATENISVNELAELNSLFSKLDYTAENWNQAQRQIPRITFSGISENWATGSSQLPVNIKKTIFFRLMAPLSLLASDNILAERQIVKDKALDSPELIEIALKYRIIKDTDEPLTELLRTALLTRVDIVPVSLTLAQSAEESGWGTSRFAFEGNAFFGQWDFTGNGMKPKQHREALGNYGVARFDTPLASVEAYMFNINSNAAYQKLRSLRAELRQQNQPLSGYELAITLDKYSERGDAYAHGVRHLINYNKLQSTDSVKLSDTPLIHIKTKR